MDDSLVPPELWVNTPDPDPEYDDSSCPVCSAFVENRALHRAWHIAIVDRADLYVPPKITIK